MRLIVQIFSVVGLIISSWYSYQNNFSFEGVVAFLSFSVAFGSSFFLGITGKMNQNQGDNSKAYQAGRDINIKD